MNQLDFTKHFDCKCILWQTGSLEAPFFRVFAFSEYLFLLFRVQFLRCYLLPTKKWILTNPSSCLEAQQDIPLVLRKSKNLPFLMFQIVINKI